LHGGDQPQQQKQMACLEVKHKLVSPWCVG
jgi:hypothetical protein